MGADIHVYIERRRSSNHPWEKDPNHTWHHDDDLDYTYRSLNSCAGAMRDYNLFAILAGVRGRGGIPKGLPLDVDEDIKEAASDLDWHSHSWATLEEFKQALVKAGHDLNYKKCEIVFPFVINYKQLPINWPNYIDIIRYCENVLDELRADALLLDTNLEPEIRLVYWFDN
jgi:hypothetical protein